MNKPLTPKALGYRFPAEWEPHVATWLSWPHKQASWNDKIETIYADYALFVKAIAEGERVCINVDDVKMRQSAEHYLQKVSPHASRIHFFMHPTNDAWCRDHGPAFLVSNCINSCSLAASSPTSTNLCSLTPVRDCGDPRKAIVGWDFNGWGGKYLPCDFDQQIPRLISRYYNIPYFSPGIVMEGGAVDVNGSGALLTTKSCLLDKNRNPRLSQLEIETYLIEYYGADQIIWLEQGLVGDETDGHIDNVARFINKNTLLTVIADQKSHPDYHTLKANREILERTQLLDGTSLDIIELSLPTPIYDDRRLLPCSYANFYICNAAVIVPLFEDPKDDLALEIISKAFPGKKIVGIRSVDITIGGGSFHCLCQQEPSI